MKTENASKPKRKPLRKGLRTTLVVVSAVLVVGLAVPGYFAADILSHWQHTDVDVKKDLTITPGSLDDISDVPTEPEPTLEPTLPDGVTPSPVTPDPTADVTKGPVTYRQWGAGRCQVYVVPSIPIRYVAQKDPDVMNVLIYGVDARTASTVRSRTDTMMVASINRRTHSVKLISFMRDTQVNMEGRTLPNKLNSAYVYGGIGLLINTINKTFDLDVQKFVMIDMASTEHVIDMAGGIMMNVTDAEVPWANKNILETNHMFQDSYQAEFLTHGGLQLLNGRQAVAYGRIRKLDSDYQRTLRQRKVAIALLAAFKGSSLLQKDDTIKAGLDAINTNIPLFDLINHWGITDLASYALASSDGIGSYRVPETLDPAIYKTDLSTYNLVFTPDGLKTEIAHIHQWIWGSALPTPTTASASTPTTGPSPTPTEPPAETPTPPAS